MKKEKIIKKIKQEALRLAEEDFEAAFYYEGIEPSEMEKFVDEKLFNHEDLACDIKTEVRKIIQKKENAWYYFDSQSDDYYYINTNKYKDHVALFKELYDDYEEPTWDYYRSQHVSFGKIDK